MEHLRSISHLRPSRYSQYLVCSFILWKLRLISQACGFGSVHIDEGFQSLVKEHVKSHRGLLHKSPEQVAWHVRDTDEYRECKHSLGTKSFEDFTFEIPFQKTNAGEPASLPRIDPFILTE